VLWTWSRDKGTPEPFKFRTGSEGSEQPAVSEHRTAVNLWWEYSEHLWWEYPVVLSGFMISNILALRIAVCWFKFENPDGQMGERERVLLQVSHFFVGTLQPLKADWKGRPQCVCCSQLMYKFLCLASPMENPRVPM